MEKITIKYTWHALGQYAKEAIVSLLTGFCKTLWAVVLLVANLAIRAYEYVVRGIRAFPCVAVGLTAVIMLMVVFTTHARMKVKLTTAEYQRDSVEMKLQRYEQFKQ